MSRGGYTAAIDMWSLGCIFGELLQRIAHVGSAATPNLQVCRATEPCMPRPAPCSLPATLSGSMAPAGGWTPARCLHTTRLPAPPGGAAVCHPRPAQDPRGRRELPGRTRQRNDAQRAAGGRTLGRVGGCGAAGGVHARSRSAAVRPPLRTRTHTHTAPPLQALFAVIGTPCWADVAAVQEPQWRRYLHHLPGRAPTLYRRCSLSAPDAARPLRCGLCAAGCSAAS